MKYPEDSWMPWRGQVGHKFPPTFKFKTEGKRWEQGSQIRKRFSFSTWDLENEIKKEQIKRHAMAEKNSADAWAEAKQASPENQTSTLAEARKRYIEAVQAKQDIDHSLAPVRTWDEIHSHKPRKLGWDLTKMDKTKTSNYLDYLFHEQDGDPMGWGSAPMWDPPPTQAQKTCTATAHG